MDDSKRAENMAKSLRTIYCDTSSLDAFVAVAQSLFYMDTFTAELSWQLIDVVVSLGAE